MASLKAIRQMWKEGEREIQDDLKSNLSQLSNATSAITQVVGLATDMSKDKKEQQELDDFAKKNDMTYNKKTGKYYGTDPKDPKNKVFEVDKSYMKALKDNPALYEDSPREMIFKEEGGEIRDTFKVKDDYSVDVKKDGITGLFQRVLPGGESGYETLDKHDVRKNLPDYKDWRAGTGDYAEKKTANPDYNPDLAGKFVQQEGSSLVESTGSKWNADTQEWEGGGIKYESLVPEFLTTGGAQYSTGNINTDGLLNKPSNTNERMFPNMDRTLQHHLFQKSPSKVPSFMKGVSEKADKELQVLLNAESLKGSLSFIGAGNKDYTRKLDAQGNITEGADWERLADDLNKWEGPQGDKLNVTGEGMEALIGDMSDAQIEHWMQYSPENIDKVNVGGLEGLAQRIVPGGESGKEYDDSARINAALGLLYNVENRKDWTIEDFEMMGDSSTQDFYEYFNPTKDQKRSVNRSKTKHEREMFGLDELDEANKRLNLSNDIIKSDKEWRDDHEKIWKEERERSEKEFINERPNIPEDQRWDFLRFSDSKDPGFKDSEYYKNREGVDDMNKALSAIPESTSPFRKKQLESEILEDFKANYGGLRGEDIKAHDEWTAKKKEEREQKALDDKRKKWDKDKKRRDYKASEGHIEFLNSISQDVYDQANLNKKPEYGLNIDLDKTIGSTINLGKDFGISVKNQLTDPFGPPSGTNMPQYFMGDAPNGALSNKSDVSGPDDDTMFAMIEGEMAMVTPGEHQYIKEHGEKGAKDIYNVAKKHAKKIGINTDDPKEWPVRDKKGKPYYWFGAAMGAVQWIGGAFSKSSAAKKEVKHIANNVLPALNKAALDKGQEGIELADKFQEEKDMLLDNAAEQVADQSEAITEKQGEMFKKTGGLKVGSVVNFAEKAMDTIGDKFDTISDNVAFQFKDKMEGMRDKVGSGLEEIGMSVKSAMDKMNAMKKKRKWYKNLF